MSPGKEEEQRCLKCEDKTPPAPHSVEMKRATVYSISTATILKCCLLGGCERRERGAWAGTALQTLCTPPDLRSEVFPPLAPVSNYDDDL